MSKNFKKILQNIDAEEYISIKIYYDTSYLYENDKKLRNPYFILNTTFINKSSYEQNVELSFSKSIEFAKCVKFKKPDNYQYKSGAKIMTLSPTTIKSDIIQQFKVNANSELSGVLVLKILQLESEYKIYVKSLSDNGKTAECAKEINIKELKPYKA